MYRHLQTIYLTVFVECVMRNTLFRYNPDDYIQCPLFEKKFEEYVRSISGTK